MDDRPDDRQTHDVSMNDVCASVALRLHGDPAVRLPDGRAVALEPRAAALLALAALEPGITRLRAAAMLWPDSADPRRNLRQQLLRFRRTFGHDLVTGQTTLTLARGAVLEASQLPLLGALSFDDCDAFAAWLDRQRRQGLHERLAAVRQQLQDAEAAGDLGGALTAARDAGRDRRARRRSPPGVHAAELPGR